MPASSTRVGLTREARARGRQPSDQGLWRALDPVTKPIPVLHLGARARAAAHAVAHSLRQRLAPDGPPAFSSDGPVACDHALTAHVGSRIEGGGRERPRWRGAAGPTDGRVRTPDRRRKPVRVGDQLRPGTREQLGSSLQGLGLSGKLNTALVERVNLTIGQSVVGLVRRTGSTAQPAPRLLAPLDWGRAHDHFSRPHESLRVPLAAPREREGKRAPPRDRPRTPAMAAGPTDRRRTVRELLALPMMREVTATA